MDKHQIDAAVAQYESRRLLYVDYARRLDGLIVDLCARAGVEPAVIESRAKDAESLRGKLGRTAYLSLDDVTDLCGIRVIVFQVSDVEPVADAIRCEHRVIEEELHGEQRADAFGYRSLHLLVSPAESRRSLPEWAPVADLVAEVQVRTVLQHAWAAISHKLDYKSEGAVPQPTRRKLFRVAALLETGDELFDQFRSEIEDLKETYSEGSRTDSWQDLDLNRESLTAAWDHFDWARVTAWAAEDLGFPDPRPIWGDASEYKDDMAERLAAIAQAVDLPTVGRLHTYVEEELSEQADQLAEVVQRLHDEDMSFWGVGADVVAMALLLRQPGVLRQYFLSEVRDAIAEVAEGS